MKITYKVIKHVGDAKIIEEASAHVPDQQTFSPLIRERIRKNSEARNEIVEYNLRALEKGIS